MMRAVVRFSLRQVVLLNVVFVILVTGGVFSLLRTPVENMPMVDMGIVFVNTVYYGASAEDVEQLVTVKLEDALDGLEHIEYIQSHSYRNYSSIKVKFIDDSDYRAIYDELRFRVLSARDELPAEADEPSFFYVDTNIWRPVVVVNVTGDLPHRSLRTYADDLRVRLAAIDSVRDVRVDGEFVTEFHVLLDPVRLRNLGVTFDQAVAAIASANTKLPTGRFRQGRRETQMDTGNRLAEQQDVLNVVVRRDGDGGFVRIADLVTHARLSHRDPSRIFSVNGRDAIRLVVIKEEDGNAVTMARQATEIAEAYARQHADSGVRVAFTNDSTIEIEDAINTLGGNLMLGMALVVLVLWATLGFRNAMLTAIGIPFSFLVSIAVMKWTGMSLNTISLFSFVLVTGIMVDDAVVVVENIYRHVEMGKSIRDAIVDGAAEVMLPVISAAITTVLAFVPMLIMTGSTGEFFSIIPKTVCFALAASLFEALLILPIHFMDWGPRPRVVVPETQRVDADPFAHLRSGLFAPVWRVYRRAVVWTLDHKWTTGILMSSMVIATLAVLFLSITGVVPLIQVKFFPGNYFRYHVTLAMPQGTAIEETDAMIRALSRSIVGGGSGQAQSAWGAAGWYEDQDYQRHTGSHYGQVVVTLPPGDRRDFPDNPDNEPMRHLGVMRQRLNDFVAKQAAARNIPGATIAVFAESDGPPAGKPVNVRVVAPTLAFAEAATDAIRNFLGGHSELADLVDIGDNRPMALNTVVFNPRQDAAYEYNLRPDQVTALVAGVLNGAPAGRYRANDEEVDLLVKVARRSDPLANGQGLASPEAVLSIPVIENATAPVYLRDLVTAVRTVEPNVRSRYSGKPSVTITAGIREASSLSAPRVQYLIDDYFQKNQGQFPGASISFGGEFESTSKSYASLAVAFLIAMMGIYMVLASQFNDYFQPMIILSAVPFALIGVVSGLIVTRTMFTVGSFLAVVGLTGLVVNDSLLLIDFINVRYRKGGMVLRDALLAACASRMRPVLITTVTTMLGLLPMAIGIPSRSITWAPMATAFVAGLSSATLLTLLLTPAVYEAIENGRNAMRRLGATIAGIGTGRRAKEGG